MDFKRLVCFSLESKKSRGEQSRVGFTIPRNLIFFYMIALISCCNIVAEILATIITFETDKN